MIVVRNASPLNDLVLVDAVDVLPKLFGGVLIPEADVRELERAEAPDPVRRWIAAPPPWPEIAVPRAIDLGISFAEGERDAHCLAEERQASLILLDDLRARKIARGRGLKVTGTLGVLEAAGERGLIDFEQVFGELRKATYRIGDDILAAARERIRARLKLRDDRGGP